MSEKLSNTKEFLLDMLYMFGVFLTSGYSIPPQFVCDRAAYQAYCERWERIEQKCILRDLKKQKLLSVKKKGEEVIFEFTQKGRVEVLKQLIKKESSELPQGIICLVSFDIPEHVRKTRSVLRRFLKKSGFKQLHQSAWYSKKDVIKPLYELIRVLEIEKWISIFKAESINLGTSFDPAVPKDVPI